MNRPVQENLQPDQKLVWMFFWFTAFFGAAGVLLISVLAEIPLILLAALPIAVAGGIAVIADTRTALCIAAFSIVPFNIIQVEILTVTVNLPEVLILVLFTKEALLILVNNKKPLIKIPWFRYSLFIGISLIVLITSVQYGNGKAAALQDWRQFIEFTVLYLLVMYRVGDRSLIKKIIFFYILGSTLIAFHGILQKHGFTSISADKLLSDRIFHNSIRSGSFYGATALGGLMVLGLGPAIGLILSTKNIFIKIVVSSFCIILLVAAVYSETRASWLAILISLGFIFISVKKKPGLIIAACLGGVMFISVLGPIVYNRMATLEISKAERSLYARIQYYRTAWYIFKSHPILGLGWGSYYNQTEILSNRRYVKTSIPLNPDLTNSSQVTVHSAYLQLLVKSGLLGLLSFFALISHWLIWVIRERYVRNKNELDHNLFIGLTAGLLGYLFHSAGENFFQWSVMSQTFWLFLGINTVMAVKICNNSSLDTLPLTAEA